VSRAYVSNKSGEGAEIFEATPAVEGSKSLTETLGKWLRKKARQQLTNLEFLRDFLNFDFASLQLKPGPVVDSFLPSSAVSEALADDLSSHLRNNHHPALWFDEITNLQRNLRRSLRDFHFDPNDPAPGRGPFLLADQIKLTFRPELTCLGPRRRLRHSPLSFAKGERLLKLDETKPKSADQWIAELSPVIKTVHDLISWIAVQTLTDSTIRLLKFCDECETFFVADTPRRISCSRNCAKLRDRTKAAPRSDLSRIKKHKLRERTKQLKANHQIVKFFDLFLIKAERPKPDPFVNFVAKRIGNHLGNGTPTSTWSIITPWLSDKKTGVSTQSVWSALSNQQQQILAGAFKDWDMDHGLGLLRSSANLKVPSPY